MKYEKELKQLLIELFNIEIEDEDDREEVKELLEKNTGTTIELLNENLEHGVSKGYSIEFQINLIKTILKSN